MFLKNYTSDVPVFRTIANIEQTLAKCGVLRLQKEFGPTSNVVALTFTIPVGTSEMQVRLPAKPSEVLEQLWARYRKETTRPRKKKEDFIDQANRTAWKLVQDWIEVQMSFIQMKQADVVEVFMAYVWDGKQTYYQAIKEANYKGLLPPSSV